MQVQKLQNKKNKIKIERNKLLTKIHTAIKNEKIAQIDETLEDLEKYPDDSRKMFDAVKNLKRMKPKRKIAVKNETGMITYDEKEQASIISKFFKNMFFKNAEKYPESNPQKMTNLPWLIWTNWILVRNWR